MAKSPEEMVQEAQELVEKTAKAVQEAQLNLFESMRESMEATEARNRAKEAEDQAATKADEARNALVQAKERQKTAELEMGGARSAWQKATGPEEQERLKTLLDKAQTEYSSLTDLRANADKTVKTAESQEQNAKELRQKTEERAKKIEEAREQLKQQEQVAVKARQQAEEASTIAAKAKQTADEEREKKEARAKAEEAAKQKALEEAEKVKQEEAEKKKVAEAEEAEEAEAEAEKEAKRNKEEKEAKEAKAKEEAAKKDRPKMTKAEKKETKAKLKEQQKQNKKENASLHKYMQGYVLNKQIARENELQGKDSAGNPVQELNKTEKSNMLEDMMAKGQAKESRLPGASPKPIFNAKVVQTKGGGLRIVPQNIFNPSPEDMIKAAAELYLKGRSEGKPAEWGTTFKARGKTLGPMQDKLDKAIQQAEAEFQKGKRPEFEENAITVTPEAAVPTPIRRNSEFDPNKEAQGNAPPNQVTLRAKAASLSELAQPPTPVVKPPVEPEKEVRLHARKP